MGVAKPRVFAGLSLWSLSTRSTLGMIGVRGL